MVIAITVLIISAAALRVLWKTPDLHPDQMSSPRPDRSVAAEPETDSTTALAGLSSDIPARNGAYSDSDGIQDRERSPQPDGTNRTEDVQSPARPYGLEIVSPVQVAESDEKSAHFSEHVLPNILDYIESNVIHGSSIDLISTDADPSNLMLPNPAAVRVYFVGEEAGYHNSIGVNYAGTDAYDPSSMLVFPDASTMYSYNPDQDTLREYTSEDCPLVPGDFIDIGTAEPGSLLDFFIIPRGATEPSEPTEVYGIDPGLNEDLTSHMRILAVVDDSMLLLGFEDQKYGGDQDFDDVIIAVEIGEHNLQSISEIIGIQ